MRIATIWVAVLATPTLATDFRTLDFGDSCAEVVSKESDLGSKATKSSAEGMGVFTFEGLEFDRQVVFSYFCSNGAFLAGDYYFPSETPSDAVASYERIHKLLTDLYGPPVMDNTPWMPAGENRDWLEKEPMRYRTTWHSARVSVNALFLPSLEDQPKGWRVTLHFGGR